MTSPPPPSPLGVKNVKNSGKFWKNQGTPEKIMKIFKNDFFNNNSIGAKKIVRKGYLDRKKNMASTDINVTLFQNNSL